MSRTILILKYIYIYFTVSLNLYFMSNYVCAFLPELFSLSLSVLSVAQ